MSAPRPNDLQRAEPAAMNGAEKSIVVNVRVAEVYDLGQSAEEYLQNFKQLVENPKR